MKNIDDILKDIYMLDPELKKQEAELRQVVEKLLASRPEIRIDKNFVKKLKKELMETKKEKSSVKMWLVVRNFALVGVGMAVMALFLLPQQSSQNLTDLDFNYRLNIRSLGQGAFGSLADESSGDIETNALTVVNDEAAATKSALAPQAVGLGGGGEMSADARMVVPFINFKYVYEGEDFSQPDELVAVLKRDKKSSLASSLVERLKSLNFGILNINQLDKLAVNNLTLAEDKEYGYMVNFDIQNDMVYINSNWSKWPQPYDDCRDEQCYNSLRLTEADVLSDEELISIANNFIRELAIDVSAFGQPEVVPVPAGMTEDDSVKYIPEYVSVVYPLTINGLSIYDEGGQKYGLNVNINIRYKKVNGVGNLGSLNYLSSDYEAETDTEKLIKIAEEGGLRYLYSQGGETENIRLQTPELIYVKMWHYNREMKDSDELLVPALRFSVSPEDEEVLKKQMYYYGYQGSIIVPLAKDLIPDHSSYPVPMPLLRAEGEVIEVDPPVEIDEEIVIVEETK